MSESLTTQLAAQLTAQLSQAEAFGGSISFPFALPNLFNAQLASGTGAADVANQLFAAQFTLAASGTLNLNLYTGGGSNDALGNAYTLAKAKLFLLQIAGNLGCYYVASATVGTGGGSSGTPYQVGDTFSLTSTGSGTGTQAVFQVLTLNGYGVGTVKLVAGSGFTGGSYTVAPTLTGVATTGGSLSSATGCTLVLTVKQVTAGASGGQVFIESDYLTLGAKGTSAGWTSLLSPNTASLLLYSGTLNMPGTVLVCEGGAAGWAVGASSTNNILLVTNSGLNPLTFQVIVVGATA